MESDGNVSYCNTYDTIDLFFTYRGHVFGLSQIPFYQCLQ